MKKSLFFLTLLAMFGASARAQTTPGNLCKFVSKDAIFPATGGDGSEGLLRITENDLNGVSDDQVELTITFHQPTYDDSGTDKYVNDYYVMSYVAPNAYNTGGLVTGDLGSNVNNDQNQDVLDTKGASSATSVAAARLVDGDVLFTSHKLQINDGVCDELDCHIKYNLLFEIGAAARSDGCSALSRSGKRAVYVRAHYHILLEIHYKRIDGAVDFSNWNNVVAHTDVLLTQTDVDRAMSFTAENVQSVAQFQMASNFLLDGDVDGACLSKLAVAQNSTSVENSDPGSAEYDNELSLCTARAYAFIEQTAANSIGAGTINDSDNDDASQSELYRDRGELEMWISQYSQMGDAPDFNGGEHLAPGEPTQPAWSDVDGQAKASTGTGDDYRLDVCHVADTTENQIGETTHTRDTAVESTTTSDFTTYEFGGSNADDDLTDTYISGALATAGSLSADIDSILDTSDDRSDINVFVACKFQLDAPSSCSDGTAACTYTPLFYLAAWFDENLPENDEFDVQHSDYDNTGNRNTAVTDQDGGSAESSSSDGEGTTTTATDDNEGGAGSAQDPGAYSADAPARRLRSAPKLLRAAAQRKLAAPKGSKRVHFMRVHLTHKH